MRININTDAVVAYTNKLEKMHRSALPNAVRGTLNKAAFNTKQDTLLRSADDTFEKRQPNFFKAYSKVDMAKGWDIKGMKATVGMVSQGLKGSNNFAVKDLEQQERGGRIKGRSFIPLIAARGGSTAKPVRPANRLSVIKKIVNAKNIKGVNNKQKFIKSAIHAGKGGYVLSEYKGKQILWRVNSLKRDDSGSFKLTALYSFENSRSVKVNQTHFAKKAALESGNKLGLFYGMEAKRQFERLMNK